jgi:hypothetical protein
MDTPGTALEDQWWVINGQVLMDALHAAHKGADPDMLYLEHLANSDTERVDGQ